MFLAAALSAASCKRQAGGFACTVLSIGPVSTGLAFPGRREDASPLRPPNEGAHFFPSSPLWSPFSFLFSALSSTGGGSRQWPAFQQERSRTLLSSESQPEFTEEGGVGITFLLGAFNFLTVLRDPFFLNFVEVLEDRSEDVV